MSSKVSLVSIKLLHSQAQSAGGRLVLLSCSGDSVELTETAPRDWPLSPLGRTRRASCSGDCVTCTAGSATRGLGIDSHAATFEDVRQHG